MKDYRLNDKYVLIVGVIAFFLVSLVFFFDRSREIDQITSRDAKTSIWLVTQAEREYLRFHNTLDSFIAVGSRTDHDDLAERFEAFLNRLTVFMRAGDSTRTLFPEGLGDAPPEGLEDALRGILRDVETLEPAVMALRKDDREAHAAVRAEAEKLAAPLHQAVMMAYLHDTAQKTHRQQRIGAVRWQIVVSFAGVFIGGAFLIVLLLRESGRASRLLHAARAADERLHGVVDNSPSAIYVKDAEGHYLLVNREAAERYGENRETMRGKTVHDLLGKTRADAYTAQDREVWETLAVRQFEVEAVRPDGTRRTLMVTKFPILDADGKAVGVGGIDTDITQRKQVEMALDVSRRRLAGILDIADDAIISVDGAHRIILFNAGAEKVFGYKADEILGRPLDLLIPPSFREGHAARLRGFTDSADVARDMAGRATIYGMRKDGSEFPAEASISQLDLEDDKVFTVILRDITKRRETEEALRDSEARFNTVAHNLPGTIYRRILHADGTTSFPYISAGVEEISGYAPDTLMAEPDIIKQSIHADDRGGWQHTMEVSAATMEPYDYEMRRVHPSGEIRWVRTMARPRRRDNGDIVWDGLALDITDRVMAEVEARTAKEDAELANRAKTEFLANMSHELRTPLNSVIGFSDMILGETFGPLGHDKYAEYAKDIHESGTHLLELINDILDLSKIEAGVTDAVEETVDVGKAARTCVKMVLDRAEMNGIHISTEVPEGLPALRADRRRVKQILLNLLSNAIKFTRPGGRVSVTARQDDHGAMVLAVHDTGVGIADEDILRIFEPFVQVEGNSHTRSHEGTGLGLSLVKSIAELHGARLKIESKIGKGTTVSVHFPPKRSVMPGKRNAALAG